MKKFFVFLAIVCIIGGVVMIAAAGVNGFKFSWNWEIFSDLEFQNLDTSHRETKSYDSFDTNNNLTIDVDLLDCSLMIKFSDLDEGALLETNSPDDHHKFTVDVSANGLKIQQTEYIDKNFGWLDTLFGKADKRYIIITLDNSLASKVLLDLELDAGSVINDGSFLEVTAEVDTGSVRLVNFNAGNIDIQVDTGAIVLSNVAAQKIECKVDTGAISATDVTAQEFFAVTETGAISLSKLSAKTVSLSTDTGAVNCTNLRDCEVFVANVNTGAVNVSMYATKAEYTISASVDTGHKNISSQTGTESEKNITVNVDTGSISFNFKNP